MINSLHAETLPQGAAAPAQASPLMSFVPLIIIFVIFYFLLIRPQQKKVTAHRKMLEGIKKGDQVVTSSGIYGSVVSVGDTSAEIKIANNVVIKILKSSISDILTAPAQAEIASPAGETK